VGHCYLGHQTGAYVKLAKPISTNKREGDVAVLFAAMLFYLYGKAKELFDMKQRPFFLLFNT
jgi:hypothetical protein